MTNKDKAMEHFKYLKEMYPTENVYPRFYLRVYNGTMVEASYEPFILDKKPYDYTMAEYVYFTGISQISQVYFDKYGETYDYAPYKDGELRMDFSKLPFATSRKYVAMEYTANGTYKCSYEKNGLILEYSGYPSLNFLQFYKLFLSYANVMDQCKTQLDVDFLERCLRKDMKIEELNLQDLDKARKIANLEDMLETHKEFINTIKELVNKNKE